MMAGHRLVNTEHLDLIFGANFGAVQIHPVNARTTAIGCGIRIVGGGRVRSDRFGNRFYAVGHARQLPEQPNELRVNAFACCEIGFVKIVWIVEIKLWVSAEEFQKLLKTAVELNFLDDLLHLIANSLDLFEAQAMNFIRCHPSCREGTRKVFV